MTTLGPWDDLAPDATAVANPDRARLAVWLPIALAVPRYVWRASVVVPTSSRRTRDQFEGIALTFPIPLMLVATALIAWGAIAMPWLAWILIVARSRS